jgi:hypothetical protein
MTCLEAAMEFDEAAKKSAVLPVKRDEPDREFLTAWATAALGLVVEDFHHAAKEILLLLQSEARVSVAVDEAAAPPCSALEQELLRVLMEHVGETGASEGAVDVARRLSNFWKVAHDPALDMLRAPLRRLNELLGS